MDDLIKLATGGISSTSAMGEGVTEGTSTSPKLTKYNLQQQIKRNYKYNIDYQSQKYSYQYIFSIEHSHYYNNAVGDTQACNASIQAPLILNFENSLLKIKWLQQHFGKLLNCLDAADF
jgi:Isocitrate lyase family